jgi:peptidoglycan glycosyltransferase
MNDYLTGSNANLDTLLNNTLDKLRGITQRGNDVITTIDAKAQQTAQDALAGHCGGAVALDPKTGRCSSGRRSRPTTPTSSRDTSTRSSGRGRLRPAPPPRRSSTASPRGLFIPGSTFKVVTATAALESGKVTPSTTFNDPGYCIEYGKKVLNFADQSGPEVFGTVTFAEALEHSINAVFCNVGKELGAAPSSTRRRSSASTRSRRSSSRPTRSRSAASTRTAALTTRATRTPSTRAGSPSARSGCR